MTTPTRAVLTTLALQRSGTLDVRVTGERHCGHPGVVDNQGRVRVRYEVRLVVDHASLDSRNFLVDQEALHEFLGTLATQPQTEPCEAVVTMWGGHLRDWIGNVNPWAVVRELQLTISPAPHAGSFTATFVGRPVDNDVNPPNAHQQRTADHVWVH